MDIRSDRGFALLEVAIAIMVMGVILGILAPSLNTLRVCSSLQSDKQKYDRICYAIAAYVIRNSHLPAPAGELNSGESGLNNSAVGFIPFKSLGLSKDLTINSAGKPIKYIPNKALVEATVIHKSTSGLGKNMFGGTACEFCARFEADSLNLDLIAQGQSVTDVTNGKSVNPVAFILFADDQNTQITIGDTTTTVRIVSASPHIKYVFRDDLMSYYAKYPCPPNP
ncbi:MAG: prepilin-type N-terminal cleavage/methylation domain-containing protein [Holosporales bacterium]|jgi:prepilin-type N-terminal cleavage/methylation domain-containing protein|nr:prepilin-type N-terminal cleavage/methylation domain-containing protein [Holosporales bacterium]